MQKSKGLVNSNHLDEKWIWQALRQMVFLEGPYLRGESRETYERLLESFGSSELFASLSAVKHDWCRIKIESC